MTSPETSYDNIRLKIAGLIQNKLFHPGKDNAELAIGSRESMTARSFFGMFFQVAWRNALESVQEMFWPVSMATMLTVTSRGFNSAAHIY
jgi:hypothetical protein